MMDVVNGPTGREHANEFTIPAPGRVPPWAVLAIRGTMEGSVLGRQFGHYVILEQLRSGGVRGYFAWIRAAFRASASSHPSLRRGDGQTHPGGQRSIPGIASQRLEERLDKQVREIFVTALEALLHARERCVEHSQPHIDARGVG